MIPTESYVIYASIGIFTGFLSGMFGIGGGSVRIPLLALAGMPLVVAFGTNMFSIPFTSSVGAYIQRRNIEWGMTKLFAIGAVLGIVIATILVGLISNMVLSIIFFFSAIVTVFALYLDRFNHHFYELIRPTKKNLIFGGLLANLLIGLRGGSGGTLFPPVLRAMHVDMHHAIATSLFTGVFSSLAALIIYFTRGDIVVVPALIVMMTGLMGSFLGSNLSLNTNSTWLKAGLSLIVVVLSLIVVFKEFY